MFCLSCSAQLAESSRFCNQCGAPTVNGQPPAMTVRNLGKRHQIVGGLMLLGAIILMLVAAGPEKKPFLLGVACLTAVVGLVVVLVGNWHHPANFE